MSDNEYIPTESPWKFTESDTCEFRHYTSLTSEERMRLKLRPEHDFRTADDDYSYFVKICEDGDILLYRSPIRAYITSTSTSTSVKPSNSQVVLSAYDIDLIRRIVVGIPLDDILWGEISGLFKRIEERGLASPGSKQEGKIVTGQ